MGWNIGEFSKKRWRIAREQKKVYREKFGEDLSTREFYKNENPITQKIVKYKLTYHLNYTNDENKYNFTIPQQTLEIYTYGSNDKNEVKEHIKDIISSEFKGKSKTWIKDNLKIDTEQQSLRGVESEKINSKDLHNIDYKNLVEQNYFTKDDINLKIKKNSNENEYKLNIWF